MSAYIIDFSDPLRAGFSIPAGGFNGPGGSSSNTSLRLYGRGALEWGEAVDEDLVRLTENFASASSPSSAIAGQLWIERALYYRDTSVGGVNTGWYYYDLNETGPEKWKQLNGISPGTVTDIRVDANIEGRYYYWNGGVTNVPDIPQGEGLYGFYSLGRYEPAAWRKRSATLAAGAPTTVGLTPFLPPQFLRTYNEETDTWSTPSPINLTPGPQPTNPYIGMLWYNTTTGILQVYTATGWQNILGPTLVPSTPTVSNGVVNMNGYNIINLANPVNPQDATTKAYVDSALTGTGGALFVAKAGDTMTGNLIIGGGAGITVSGNAALNTLTTSGLATANSLAVTNNATVTGTLAVNSPAGVSTIAGINFQSSRITNLALTPALPSEATSKSYVDAQIAASGAGALTPAQVSLVAPAVPKDGDILVVGTVISIRAAGVWRQVFPAQWAA